MRSRISAAPRLTLVADGFTRPEVAEQVRRAVAAGVAWVQLRDHAASPSAFAEAAAGLITSLRAARPDVVISVNGRVDVAARLGCGLHLGGRGPSVAEARRALGADALIGVSAHDRGEGDAAVSGGADYLFYSPVFPTGSKPGHPGAGLAALRAFCTAFPDVPVYALGGITPERVASCRAAGACGVAVLSGILAAPDVPAAVHAYQTALSER